ncbi:SDR family oxidoreductase [Kribbella sp. NPDC056951]|uniref:SDR family oxidoreductase n=1 Tax=Kribbella sp. NPDC056951 TaxID=3345978 RepID=UPI0036421695
MKTILVTGGTGRLGRPTVERLRAAGHTVRVLSRRTGSGLMTGDLSTGDGIAAAVDGVDLVVHLATGLGRRDVQQARTLLSATPAATHVIYMSIVGVDEIPLSYYRYKLEAERLVEAHPAHTILRATQFHSLLDKIFSLKLPALFAPAAMLQPIAVEDIAARLTELVADPIPGRAADIGGPESVSIPDLARTWKAARNSRRPVVPLRIPGKIFRAYTAGSALVPGPPYGTITFADYLDGGVSRRAGRPSR